MVQPLTAHQARQYVLDTTYDKFQTTKPFQSNELDTKRIESILYSSAFEKTYDKSLEVHFLTTQIPTIESIHTKNDAFVKGSEVRKSSQRKTYSFRGNKNEYKCLTSEAKWSTLLFYTLGLLRYEPENSYPYHRGIPSARCLYSTSLYVIPSDLYPINEGVYTYDALNHSLIRVNERASKSTIMKDVIIKSTEEVSKGDVIEARVLKEDEVPIEVVSENVVSDEVTYLIVTAHTLPMLMVYGNFSYNLCTLEAGHAIAQLTVLAERLHMKVNVHYTFRASDINRMCQLDDSFEIPIAVLSIEEMTSNERGISLANDSNVNTVRTMRTTGTAETARTADTQKRGEAHAQRYSKRLLKQYREQCQSMYALIKASAIEKVENSSSEIGEEDEQNFEEIQHNFKGAEQYKESHQHTTEETKQDFEAEQHTFEDTQQNELSLDDIIYATYYRTSGNDLHGLMSKKSEMSTVAFQTMLSTVNALMNSCQQSQYETNPIKIYMILQNVEEHEQGVYVYEPYKQTLVKIKELPHHKEVQQHYTVGPNHYNMASLPLFVVFTVNYEHMFTTYGNRGYQLAQMRAGELGQYFCLAASLQGYFARATRSHKEYELEQLLQTSGQVVYQILIGHNDRSQHVFNLSY